MEPTPWRVYRKDWLFDRRVDEGWNAAREYVDARFASKLDPADVELIADRWGRPVVWVHRWNVAGEWKREDLAEDHRDHLRRDGVEAVVVERNSRDEQALKQYGLVGRAS